MFQVANGFVVIWSLSRGAKVTRARVTLRCVLGHISRGEAE